MSKKINREVVVVSEFTTSFLKSLFGEGKLATVNFTKKKDGSNRTLNGKATVKAALKGGEASYDAESRGQVRIVDVNIHRDKDGNKIPRKSEFRAVTAQNVNWVTSGGKKYVRGTAAKPELNFIQSQSFDRSSGVLRLTLSGHVYRFFNVPRSVHVGLIEAENKGQYFNDNIRNKYKYIRVN